MTKCHLPPALSVCCHLKDKPLTSKGCSHGFFLLRNCDLTLCVSNGLHYCCDWVLCTGCPWFPLQSWDLKDVPIPGIFQPFLCCSCVQTLSGMTQWQMILPWSRGSKDPSRSLSGSGGFDGSVAGSILAKWCFSSGQSTDYGKSVFSMLFFVGLLPFIILSILNIFLSFSNLYPGSKNSLDVSKFNPIKITMTIHS